jgi:prolipoprotein diacylglyceryltransferase
LHFPVSIHLGKVDIPLHVITETLGIFIGFRYFMWLRKKQSDVIETNNRIWILIGAIFGSVIGSRLIGGLEDITALQKSTNTFMYFYQNKTVLGGFLFGVWGVELVKLCIGEKKASGDIFVYPILLALIIGRIGCFSMGVFEETYGTASTLPWAMNLGDGLLRHPVALYEILFLLILWIAIYQFEKKYALANGARFKIFMMAYLCFRFILDFIKPHYTFNIGLSTIQITCVVGLMYYGRYLLKPSLLIEN